jgi:hypothetical protein
MSTALLAIMTTLSSPNTSRWPSNFILLTVLPDLLIMTLLCPLIRPIQMPLYCFLHCPLPPPHPSVPIATAYPYHSIMTNVPLQFSSSPGPHLATACSTISLTICTGSHHLLSHRTVPWLSLTPHFGAIPFALATHSALLPVASIVVQPDLSVATPLFKATLPNSSFVSYSLPQLLHHLRLLRTPAIFESTPLNSTLDWFFDHYSRITGIDCSCPHTSLPDQLL